MRRRALIACLCLGGCASAIPTATGGSTTPKGRSDVALGGAARVPTGDLRDPGPLGTRVNDASDAGGVVPVGLFRYGITRHLDVGAMVAGTVGRLELRGELGAREGSTRPTWIWAIAPYVGAVPDRDDSGSGVRFGLDVPFAYGIDFGGIYDFWIGPRLGIEGVTGTFRDEVGTEGDGWQVSLRTGATIGLAAGFRRVHALLEVTVAWEQQWGDHLGIDLGRGGFVVIPAFGLRVRI